MSDFQPLDPPRFEYIEAVQKNEIDYKSAYELQRITIRRLCLLSTKLLDALEPACSGNTLQEFHNARTMLNNILLET
jgi:hypothetical protein